MPTILPELRYTSSHEWVSIEGDTYTIGLTDFAQDALGDLVFVNLPQEGDEVVAGEAFAALARLERAGRPFDLVFCDPPYHKGLFERALSFFDGGQLLAERGILVVEHGGDEDVLPALSALVRVDGRRYGKTTQLSFFQRRSYLAEVEADE